MVKKRPKFKVGDKVIIVGPNFFGNYEPNLGLGKGDIAEVLVNEPDKDGDIEIKSKEGNWRYWLEENLAPATRAHRILYT